MICSVWCGIFCVFVVRFAFIRKRSWSGMFFCGIEWCVFGCVRCCCGMFSFFCGASSVCVSLHILKHTHTTCTTRVTTHTTHAAPASPLTRNMHDTRDNTLAIYTTRVTTLTQHTPPTHTFHSSPSRPRRHNTHTTRRRNNKQHTTCKLHRTYNTHATSGLDLGTRERCLAASAWSGRHHFRRHENETCRRCQDWIHGPRKELWDMVHTRSSRKNPKDHGSP